MSSIDPRKAYWNDNYMEYWRARVAEAGSGDSDVVHGDARTEDDEVYESVFAANPFRPGNLLDVGCAWGRMFPLYLQYGLQVSGIDISTAMIEAARAQWAEVDWVERIEESTAEQLPFSDASFDNLVCLGTFDATYQHQAMGEFLRVTRPRARLYVTGKHNHYALDDTRALAAEIGARGKGHPNYFTDTLELIDQMEGQGHRLLHAYYFLRRGDFAAWNYQAKPPDNFYEYFLIFERGESWQPLEPCAYPYSRTFLQQKGEA